MIGAVPIILIIFLDTYITILLLYTFMLMCYYL